MLPLVRHSDGDLLAERQSKNAGKEIFSHRLR